MSFDNYSDLKTSVADWLARADLTDTIPDFITLFESEANRRLRTRKQEITISTTPSSGAFDLPTDYLTWKTLWWQGNGLNQSLEFVEPSEQIDRFPDRPAANPEVFTVYGTTDSVGFIQIMPIDNNALNFTYYQKITSLSTGNATNWLLQDHPDAYLAGSMAEACAFTKDWDQAAVWKTRRDDFFDKIIELDKQTRGPSRIRAAGKTP